MKILNKKLPFFTFALILGVMLYWHTFSGTPIWDDSIYIFEHPIKDAVSFLEIFLNFAWPISVAFQKVEYLIFGTNYYFYHIVNFSLHFINSLLIYHLLKKYKISHARWIFLLFFLHPANVISVSWIIQLKTLLSFFLGILSLKFFLRSTENENNRYRYLLLSFLLFVFSFFAKPASIFIPVFFFFVLIYKKLLRKYISILVIMAVVALAGSYRTISRSSDIIEEVQNTQELSGRSLTQTSIYLLKSSHYYFWQSYVPIDTTPVKGAISYDLEIQHWIHLFFLFSLTLICFKFHKLWPFLFGHIMLIPFLGLIPAPYMVLTWVSDQHLYFALPLFLLFFVRVLDSWKSRFPDFILALMLILFSFKTYQTNNYYRNEVSFFEASYESNPLNMGVALNLTNAYLRSKNFNKAQDFLNQIVELSMSEKSIHKDPHFVHLLILKMQLNQ